MKYLKVVAVAALASLAFACSPKLPQADVDAATAAFNDAKTAQADIYAADAYKAADAANTTLQADLSSKSYAKAKTDAKALLDASTAAKGAVDAGKATMKTSLDASVTAVTAELPVVQKELAKALKAGKKAKLDVKPYKTLVADTQKGLSDVKTAEDAGNIADAATKATALQAALDDAKAKLEAAGYKA
ncbi:MAG TPA: hypothetical protein VMV44_07000 [Rectinemataceae bacterium]|nr:hypothetical protein [Rectinemataceae bacterium]